MQNPLPTRIKSWLNNRGITDQVISDYQISWDGRIIIPIENKGFNKYRRDPESEIGPKYYYDKGASSELFGLKSIIEPYVIVVEGELDSLCLISKGFQAVSSTGGASTFDPEWSKILPENVYICYDTDDAGIKGAFHVQKIIPRATIIWLPTEIKDITDYFVKLEKTKEDFEQLKLQSVRYRLPKDWREAEDKKELQAFEKEYREEIDNLMMRAREIRGKYNSDRPLQFLIQIWMTKFGEVKRQIKYFQPQRKQLNQGDLLKAKAVPIPKFIEFNKDNTARCIFHSEKTPSMYYYEKQNKVYCFGCSKGGDVIDVVQKMNSVGLKEAINLILKA